MRINIVFFLILITCLNVFSKSTTAQISLHIVKGDLETVFKAIEKQTDYSFMYEVSLLKGSGVVSIDVRNAGLVEVLDEVFRGQRVYYEVISKTIVVKEKVGSGLEAVQEEKNAIVVKGKVTDKQNRPLEGVSVRIKGTNSGAVTDQSGNYSITADPNGVIVFSYIGYKTLNIMISGQTEINMTMIENDAILNETVIKGYYKTTRELNTGNVTTVKGTDIARQPISNPISGLIGRVPGLVVQEQTGSPGRNQIIRLRGQNSIANGNNPLFIIDGVQYNSNTPTVSGTSGISITPYGGGPSPFNFLNVNDIEKIEILKDADATAIYGSRGANGVILISTKQGEPGKTAIELNAYSGRSSTPLRVSYLKLPEYLQMRREAFANDNKQPGTADFDLNGVWDTTSYIDWQKMLVGNNAKVDEISGTLMGGAKQANFRIGATYRNETTVFPEEFYSRKASFHSNYSYVSLDKKLSINFSAGIVNNKTKLPTASFSPTALYTLAPNFPGPYNKDGSLYWDSSQRWDNPLSIFMRNSEEKSTNLLGNLTLEYKLIDNLNLGINLGYNSTDFNQENLIPFTSYNPARTSQASALRVNEFLDSKATSWIAEPQLTYNKSFLSGNIEVLLGTTFQSSNRDYLAMDARGFSSDAGIENFAAGSIISTRGKSNTEYRYTAIYSRIGYSYKNKYSLNFTGRRDGSSRFGPKTRFGSFGAFGLAWVFTNEKFGEYLKILSFGKIRASYGSTGNDQLTDYQYLDTYSTNTAFYQGVIGLNPTQLTNPYYGWERVNKIEVALETGLFENRCFFNVSFYRNRTHNQLVQYALPSVAGFTSVRANLPAIIENKGIEIDLRSIQIQTKNFEWSTGLNFSIPRSKLVSYPNIESSSYANTYVVGKPMTLFSGYNYTGISSTTGLFTFEDVNRDNAITRTFDNQFYFQGIKSYGGISNNLKYRSLELDFLFQFTNQVGRAYNRSTVTPGYFNLASSNQPMNLLKSENRQPYSQSNSIIQTNNSLFNSSNGNLTDASFLRLKNVSLVWTIPTPKSVQRYLKKTSIYFQGNNLLTFTNYKGFDPEFPSNAAVLATPVTITGGLRILL